MSVRISSSSGGGGGGSSGSSMQPPILSVPSRPPHPTPFLRHHHHLPPQPHLDYHTRPQPKRLMATDNPFGHDFGLGPHHLDDGLLTPMLPCGTPSFEQYMPDHESLSLTQWRKSPAISATMSWGGFRPMDYGTSLNTTWDFHQATASSGRSPMVNATSSDVRKVEYGTAAAGPSTVNDNTNGRVPSISADNSAVTIHKVDNSPVQSASSHPTYPAPRLLHGGNGEVALKVDTNVHGLTHKHPTYPHHVNPSDFQPVSNNDWCLKMPVGQDASSPSTIDTPCDGPLTPPGDDVGIAPQGILLSNAPATLPHMPQEDYDQTSSGFPIPPTFAFPTPFSSFSSNYEASPTVWSTGPNFTYSGSATNYHDTHNQPMLGFGSEVRQEAPLPAPRPTRLTSTTSFENMARGAMDTTPEPSEITEDEEESEPELDINDQAVSEANHRLQRDRFLLQMRSQGLSYKEIKRRGRFREAESTLRGRVRVLTKKKEDRVRKPEWTINDIELLRRAVERYTNYDDDGDDGTYHHSSRVPWKKISSWMKHNGSSYKFAPATCAKKWKEVN